MFVGNRTSAYEPYEHNNKQLVCYRQYIKSKPGQYDTKILAFADVLPIQTYTKSKPRIRYGIKICAGADAKPVSVQPSSLDQKNARWCSKMQPKLPCSERFKDTPTMEVDKVSQQTHFFATSVPLVKYLLTKYFILIGICRDNKLGTPTNVRTSTIFDYCIHPRFERRKKHNIMIVDYNK